MSRSTQTAVPRVLAGGLLALLGAVAQATPIDLRAFYVDPLFADSITLEGVSAETSTARLDDDFDGFLGLTNLTNDPAFYVPPESAPVINSGPAGLETLLSFDFDFVTADFGAEFGVSVFDAALGAFAGVLGDGDGDGFTDFFDVATMGTFQFDISPYDFDLGIEFTLFDTDFVASSVLISRLQVTDPTASPPVDPTDPPVSVPEPGTFLLLLAGLAGLLVARRTSA